MFVSFMYGYEDLGGDTESLEEGGDLEDENDESDLDEELESEDDL